MTSNKKVIVTGGAGFIGSHTVVELVGAGYDPVIVDDLRNSEERALQGIGAITGRSIPFHRIDITDRKTFAQVFEAEGPIAGVIHFAAYKAVGESVKEPLKYYGNNICSLVVLLQLMKDFHVGELVFSSSCTVYGQPDLLPVTEKSPDQQANSPYGFTKIVCEQLLRDQCAADPKLKVVMLRYFNPIGAHTSGLIGELPIGVPNNLVPFVTQTAAGIREQLTVNGADHDTSDGSCIRDYIHVMDLAQAHLKAFEWMRSADTNCEVFNVGTGKGDTVLDVVRTFEKVNGVKVPYVIGPRRAGDVVSIYADTKKCTQVLGWQPQFGLGDALRDAWRWQQHLMKEQPQTATSSTTQQ